jgi:hypothetical protein
VKLQANHFVAVTVLAATISGVIAHSGGCLPARFSAARPKSQQVVALRVSDTASTPLVDAACFSDSRISIASVSEPSTGIRGGTPVLADIPASNTAASPPDAMRSVSGRSLEIPPSFSPAVLRI